MPITVETEAGTVEGRIEGHGVLFRAVPYAAPPIGERRFEPAAPPEPWTGAREADGPGPGAVQPYRRQDPWDAYFNPISQSLDCLTLQVHTPDPGAGGLPVLVWIHGGGFMVGTGSAPAYCGSTWARDGIVHVAINYRTAIDGYTFFADSLERGAENLGLRDQVAALAWVRRNIAAFGGDPERVTIMGESAGACSVALLMACPQADGLFARAVMQSGFPDASLDTEGALVLGRRLAELAGREPTTRAMADLGDDDARRAMDTAYDQALWASLGQGRQPLAFPVVHGTPSLPAPVLDALAAGASRDVPLLLGTNSDEAAGQVVDAGLADPEREGLLAGFFPQLGLTPDLVAAYRQTRGSTSDASIASIAVGALTDRFFRMPSIRTAEAHRGITHLYQFAWNSPLRPAGLGADHTFDIPFVQDDFASLRAAGPIGDQVLGTDPPRQLAEAMHGAFVRFVSGGDPGWAPYEPGRRTTMRFDTDSGPVDDLAGAVRELWDAR